MAWNLIFWVLCFFICIPLIASSFYQFDHDCAINVALIKVEVRSISDCKDVPNMALSMRPEKRTLWIHNFQSGWIRSILIDAKLLCLVDLEADHLNPFEASSRINPFVIPEFLVQGLLAVLFLATQNWLMFLMVFPLTCYHVRLYMKRQHLISATEVFRDLEFEKMFRKHKLLFYLSLLIIHTARLAWAVFCYSTGKTSFIDLF